MRTGVTFKASRSSICCSYSSILCLAIRALNLSLVGGTGTGRLNGRMVAERSMGNIKAARKQIKRAEDNQA